MKRHLLRRPPLLLSLVLGLVLGWAPSTLHASEPCDVHTEDLKAGEPVTDLAGLQTCPSGPVFVAEVPTGATRLMITTSGGSGNADLLVRFGEPPSSSVFDRASSGPGNLETVIVDFPAAGKWYIQLYPRATFSGVTLVANFDATEQEVEDGKPLSGLSDDRLGGVQYFTINVPPGTANLDVATSGGTGNVDLFVRRAFLPTTTVFDAASQSRTNAERICIASPQGGVFKIALVASGPFSGVTLVVTLTPTGACTAAPGNLCLLNGRFKVEVTWINQHATNATGVGTAIPGTDVTGYFWFFSADNTELVVKMLDGRTLNNHFWVFHGGLSDVDYTIKVTDTQTGVVKTYRNPPGTLSSEGDTAAF